jgi:trk system potassium uptake protein TrkH
MSTGDRKAPRRRRLPTPARAAIGFLVGLSTIIAIGTVLLASPLASTSGQTTSVVDALFTAVSAATDTGLAVVDTAEHWNVFGQLVIAALAFLGGVGIMASATIVVVLGRRTTLDNRAQVSDAFGGHLGTARDIARGTLVFAVAAQVVGAIAFGIAFVLGGDESEAGGLLWSSVFSSISAFNNAGFDIVGGGRGFTAFADRPAVLAVTAALIVLGGLGFGIVFDMTRKRRWARFALETKLVLVATVGLIVLGAVGIVVTEWTNPGTLGALPSIDRIWNGTFMSISPRSAGFSSVDMSALRPETDIIMIVLMFIGTASGSTGGGIKVNTLAVLVLVAVSVAVRRDDPTAFGRRVTIDSVFRAIAVFFIFSLMSFVGLLVVAGLSNVAPGATLFEVVSALGTVGLSLGVTPDYGEPARLALAVCMFVGRLGPLAVIILLFGRGAGAPAVRHPEEPIRIG